MRESYEGELKDFDAVTHSFPRLLGIASAEEHEAILLIELERKTLLRMT